MSAGCSLCCWIQHTSSKPEKCLTIYDSIIYSDWFSKFASDSMSTSHHPSVKVGSEKYFAVLKVQEQHNPEPPPVTAPLRRQAVEHFFLSDWFSSSDTRTETGNCSYPIQQLLTIQYFVSYRAASAVFTTLCTLCMLHVQNLRSYLFISFYLLRFINLFFFLNQSCFSIFFFLILPSLFIFHWSFFLCCCCNNTGTCQIFCESISFDQWIKGCSENCQTGWRWDPDGSSEQFQRWRVGLEWGGILEYREEDHGWVKSRDFTFRPSKVSPTAGPSACVTTLFDWKRRKETHCWAWLWMCVRCAGWLQSRWSVSVKFRYKHAQDKVGTTGDKHPPFSVCRSSHRSSSQQRCEQRKWSKRHLTKIWHHCFASRFKWRQCLAQLHRESFCCCILWFLAGAWNFVIFLATKIYNMAQCDELSSDQKTKQHMN